MKIQRKPHIHMMDLYNEHYGYDVNTNAIFKISDELAKYLKAVLDSEECNYENLYLSQDAQDGLDYLLSQGLLLEIIYAFISKWKIVFWWQLVGIVD